MKTRKKLRGLVLVSAMAMIAFAAYADNVSISTYYPSPYGSYQNLTTTTDTYLATTSGKVGIGTTSPGAKLDIGAGAAPRGGNTDLLIGTGGNVPQIELYHTSKSSAISYDGATLNFYTNGGSWVQGMVIDNSGNVGIGTTNPGVYKLNVAGTANIDGTIRIKDAAGNAGTLQVDCSTGNCYAVYAP